MNAFRCFVAIALMSTGTIKLISVMLNPLHKGDPVFIGMSQQSVMILGSVVELLLASVLFRTQKPGLATALGALMLGQCFLYYHMHAPLSLGGCGCLGNVNLHTLIWAKRVSKVMFGLAILIGLYGGIESVQSIAGILSRRVPATRSLS